MPLAYNVLRRFHLPQKQSETGYYEAETHERQAGANPSQERALRRQRHTGVIKDRAFGRRDRCCCFTHERRMMARMAATIKNVYR